MYHDKSMCIEYLTLSTLTYNYYISVLHSLFGIELNHSAGIKGSSCFISLYTKQLTLGLLDGTVAIDDLDISLNGACVLHAMDFPQ